jgi:hypothetical protein
MVCRENTFMICRECNVHTFMICRENTFMICRENTFMICRENTFMICRECNVHTFMICRENTFMICRENTFMICRERNAHTKGYACSHAPLTLGIARGQNTASGGQGVRGHCTHGGVERAPCHNTYRSQQGTYNVRQGGLCHTGHEVRGVGQPGDAEAALAHVPHVVVGKQGPRAAPHAVADHLGAATGWICHRLPMSLRSTNTAAKWPPLHDGSPPPVASSTWPHRPGRCCSRSGTEGRGVAVDGGTGAHVRRDTARGLPF